MKGKEQRLIELLIKVAEETQLMEGMVYGVYKNEIPELWGLIEKYQKENSLKSFFNNGKSKELKHG